MMSRGARAAIWEYRATMATSPDATRSVAHAIGFVDCGVLYRETRLAGSRAVVELADTHRRSR
jgi:hypothetical protein